MGNGWDSKTIRMFLEKAKAQRILHYVEGDILRGVAQSDIKIDYLEDELRKIEWEELRNSIDWEAVRRRFEKLTEQPYQQLQPRVVVEEPLSSFKVVDRKHYVYSSWNKKWIDTGIRD